MSGNSIAANRSLTPSSWHSLRNLAYVADSKAPTHDGRVRQGGVISAVAVGHRQAALAVMCRG